MERGSGSVPIVMEEEKLRAHLHTGGCSPGRCQARWFSHAFRKGKHGPQLPFSASWRESTPTSFDAAPLGTYPRGGGFSLVLLFALPHFLKPWIGYPCLRNSK